jgi:hypothetical protein
VPISTAAYAAISGGKGGNVSAMINLVRIIGGSVGISLVETMDSIGATWMLGVTCLVMIPTALLLKNNAQ